MAEKKAECRTKWVGWVEHGQGHGATSVQGANVGALLADVYRTVTYMHGIGRTGVKVTGLARECVTCHGNGNVPSRRTKKRCPDCKGVGTFETLPDIPLEPSTNVEIIERRNPAHAS